MDFRKLSKVLKDLSPDAVFALLMLNCERPDARRFIYVHRNALSDKYCLSLHLIRKGIAELVSKKIIESKMEGCPIRNKITFL